MVSVFCVGVGEFLTFSAMVLAILVNMGQITQNIVARNIYWTSLDTAGFQSDGTTVAGIFATNQASPEGAMNGLKNTYNWGLYNYCGGSGKQRACSKRSFGYKFQPLNVLDSDVAAQYTATISSAVSTSKGKFADTSYLGKFSEASSYLAFIGTITIGLSFLVAFLAHRFAFLLASLLALLSSGIFFVAAAIWTAILYKARQTLSDGTSGLNLHYGNALWMEWAAAVAAFLSVIPLFIACLSGRESKY